MPAVIVTGVANVTDCQPEAVSFVNVACASGEPPVEAHRLPTWVPVFAASL